MLLPARWWQMLGLGHLGLCGFLHSHCCVWERSDSGFPQHTSMVILGCLYKGFRCPRKSLWGGGVVSALLSAESEGLATKEGDTKSLPNHFLNLVLWSNANLAKKQCSDFGHRQAATHKVTASVVLFVSLCCIYSK